MNSKIQYDHELWFFHKGCAGKHFLLGNAHTFKGRMRAWCPVNERPFLVSKSEMEEKSEQARYWIAGFLHGNQPEPPIDEIGEADIDGQEFQQWTEAIRLFIETGYWWSGEPRNCESCGREILAAEPAEICRNCRSKEV